MWHLPLPQLIYKISPNRPLAACNFQLQIMDVHWKAHYSVKQHLMDTASKSFHVITSSDLSSFIAMKRGACFSRLIIFAITECYIWTLSREGCEIYKWRFFYKRREGRCQSILPTQDAFSFRRWLTVLILLHHKCRAEWTISSFSYTQNYPDYRIILYINVVDIGEICILGLWYVW
jgi:hypothetical protein